MKSRITDVELKEKELYNKIEELGGKRMEMDGINYYQLDEPNILLGWAVKNGFLLHGSPKLFEDIEPRKANDTNRPLGSLLAVYLSRFVETAIVNVLIGNISGGYSFVRDKNGEIKSADVHVADLSKINENGFVYIVDDAVSKEVADGDMVAYNKIKPIVRVAINRKDFPLPILER